MHGILLEVAKRQLSIKWFVSIFKWSVLPVNEMFVLTFAISGTSLYISNKYY